MNPRSSTLFHFATKLHYLNAILAGGFVPRYYLEDIRWLGIDNRNYAAYPMVCFCDIPLSRITGHTSFYGGYGLGMTQEWALRNALAPVLYSTTGSPIPRIVDDLFAQHVLSFRSKIKGARLAREALLVSTLAFTKPLTGRMRRGTREVEKNFYQESEWRYVPTVPNDQLVLEDRFLSEKSELNKSDALLPLTFSAKDVRYILVKRERDLVTTHKFIMKRLNRPADELATLATRLISLEALDDDM